MSSKTFDLQPDEQILLKTTRVQRGRWSAYTGDLILTDRALIYVDRGLLGNYKGYARFDLSEINQALVGEAPNGSDQLEVYHAEGEDDFGFNSGGKREVKAWKKAIDKQLERHGKHPVDDDDGEGPSIGDVIGSVAEAGGAVLGGVVQGVGRAAAGFVSGLGIGGDEDGK